MSDEEQADNTFDFIWIVRCRGTNCNRNVEYRLVPDAPANGIKPLIEVVNPSVIGTFASRLRSKYGEIMVDLPFYLTEKSNKFDDEIEELNNNYLNQAQFFQAYQNIIDIPVVSASHTGIVNYNVENAILANVRQNFEKVAVRARVPTFDLSTTPTTLRSYESLINNMRHPDLLLLDVFRMQGIEPQVDSNLELMSRLGKEHNLAVYVLNAFEPFHRRHNYGPLFSYKYDLDGFGDFATEKRFPSARGRPSRRIVRYYYWDKYELREIAQPTYRAGASQLQSSAHWRNHPQHRASCNACREVQQNPYNEGHSYWKRFRMLHYLNSIMNETRHHFAAATDEQDLDPDGYDLLFNLGAN